MKENYYIACDDGEHWVIDSRKATREEAEVVFNELITNGRFHEHGGDGWEEVEMGFWDEDDENSEIEPLLHHSFTDETN